MKKLLKALYIKLGSLSPLFYYLIQYKRARSKLYSNTTNTKLRETLFSEFIGSCEGERCLQIGVKDSIGRKFGPNWVSVDKYDRREFIDYNYDINELKFEDESFDAIVCWSILEHIPYPHKAIGELRRVLKPGGKIWVQLPFLFPYHESPKDYWRVSPDGLRMWMEGFHEIACGCDFWTRTSLIAATYFYGTK